jgi:hypothetical protein
VSANAFEPERVDPKHPDPWLALYLDQSLPINEAAKQALLIGNRSVSRRWLFPIARPLILAFFIVVKILRALSPRWPNWNRPLHELIFRGLKNFATPEANTLILRHFTLATLPHGPLNVIDVQTAVEAYTPIYALFLPREDFLRAVNSLQLDEVIAIYIAKILGNDYHLAFMKNGHPLVPLSTLEAGYRLMMHGLDVEGLHGWLRILKRRQAAGLPIDPRSPTAAATV